MRSVRVLIATSCLALTVGVEAASAQTLTLQLFERYLDSLREQASVPGMSVAVVQNGTTWSRGLGKQDLEANTAASPDTPYQLGGVSQVFGAAMTLRACLEEHTLELTDRVIRWVPSYPDDGTRIVDLLSHTSTAGSFTYDLDRFSALTGVVEECDDIPYAQALTARVFDPLGMGGSVPGANVGATASRFVESTMARFSATLQRVAPAYRLDRGRLVRADLASPPLSAATGIVSTATDLGRFMLSLESGLMLQTPTLASSWTQVTAANGPQPAGLGWFVTNRNGETVVWQFGSVQGGHSALLVSVPGRRLSFVALANSDGIVAPYRAQLEAGDLSATPFGALFLRFFLP